MLQAGELIINKIKESKLIRNLISLNETEKGKFFTDKILLIGNGSKIKRLDKRLEIEINRLVSPVKVLNNEELGDNIGWLGTQTLINKSLIDNFKLDITKDLKGSDYINFIMSLFI